MIRQPFKLIKNDLFLSLRKINMNHNFYYQISQDQLQVIKFLNDLYNHLEILDQSGRLPVKFDPEKISLKEGGYRFSSDNLFTNQYYQSDCYQPLVFHMVRNLYPVPQRRQYNPFIDDQSYHSVCYGDNDFIWINIDTLIIEIIHYLQTINPRLSILYDSYLPKKFDIYYNDRPVVNIPQAEDKQGFDNLEELKQQFINDLTRGLRIDNRYSRSLSNQERNELYDQYYPWRTIRLVKKLFGDGENVFTPTKFLYAADNSLILEGEFKTPLETKIMVAKTKSIETNERQLYYRFFIDFGYLCYQGEQLISNQGLIMDKLDPLPDQIDFKKMARDLISQFQFIHADGYCHDDLKPPNVMYKDGFYYLIDLEFLSKQQGCKWFSGTFNGGAIQIIEAGPDISELMNVNKISETGYRNDMLRLGFLLNYLITKDITNYKKQATIETTNYLNYFGKMPFNQLLTPSDYQTAMEFFE